MKQRLLETTGVAVDDEAGDIADMAEGPEDDHDGGNGN
jgi:hypothetical protein